MSGAGLVIITGPVYTELLTETAVRDMKVRQYREVDSYLPYSLTINTDLRSFRSKQGQNVLRLRQNGFECSWATQRSHKIILKIFRILQNEISDIIKLLPHDG